MAIKNVGFLAVGALAILALSNRGTTPMGSLANVTNIWVPMGAHRLLKTPGVDRVDVSGSFSYEGPANTVEVRVRFLEGSSFRFDMLQLISVPESFTPTSHTFSRGRTVPDLSSLTDGNLLNGEVEITEQLGGGIFTGGVHSAAYEISRPPPSPRAFSISASYT